MGVSADEDKHCNLCVTANEDKHCNLWFSKFYNVTIKEHVGDNGYIRVGFSLLDIGEILDLLLVCGWDILSTSIPMFRISWISHQLYKCIVCECNCVLRNIILVY